MKIIERFEFEDITGFKFGKSPFGKPSLNSIIYFVDGTLIDTGHRNMEKDIFETVKDLAVQQIFITHHHEDHTGNLIRLKDHFACPAYASSLCVEMMKDPPPISPAQKFTWGDRPPSQVLEARDGSFDTPKFSFELHPVPGHARDMVALYEPSKKWLLSADLYLHHFIGYFLRNENIGQQISSIKRILELDFDALLCSHRPVFKGGKEKLALKLANLEKFYEGVRVLYEKGYSDHKILREIELRENWFIRLFSLGGLSALNMVRSAMRDLEKE